jgi:deoxyinosine 3'endonuclease (endonuclease V)
MREAEHLVDLIRELRDTQPDGIAFPQVFLVDGNGRLHEREAGLATVVGVLADVPTIGCAKDYHPVIAFHYSINNIPDWRLTRKAFKNMCRKVLRQRGDWLGIYGKDTEHYIGAVSVGRVCHRASG